MELQVVDTAGKKVKSIQLPDSIFAVPMNEHVLHTVCKAYRANRRQGTHATKGKGMISGGGKKPFRQKGTGNARQGSSRSPLQKGGGVIHGPVPRSYRQNVPQKVKQLALKVALSEKVRHGKLVVMSDMGVSGYSTKHMIGVMKAVGADQALFSDERQDDLLRRSTGNIHGALAVRPAEVNAENVLRYESLIVSENAINTITQRLEGGANASV